MTDNVSAPEVTVLHETETVQLIILTLVYNLHSCRFKPGAQLFIDRLRIYQKNQYNLFFENLIAAGFQPKISLPTHLTDHSATLLDNIFCNRIDNNESARLTNKSHFRPSNDIYI